MKKVYEVFGLINCEKAVLKTREWHVVDETDTEYELASSEDIGSICVKMKIEKNTVDKTDCYNFRMGAYVTSIYTLDFDKVEEYERHIVSDLETKIGDYSMSKERFEKILSSNF